jgi:hypothetical protein
MNRRSLLLLALYHVTVQKDPTMKSSMVAAGLILAIIVCGLAGAVIGYSLKGSATVTTTSTSTVTTSVSASTSSEIQGIVTGIVTVEGQTEPSNLSSYALVFVRQCSPGPNCPISLASIYPTGHYSILLNPGNYTVSWLFPFCPWAGCSSALPQKVTVVGGMQVVLNIDF